MVGNIKRILSLPKNQSFFLFGARGVGKSTLLRQVFNSASSLWIDLLDLEQESHFSSYPNDLKAQVLALPDNITHIIIDEIQKIPKLLDVVHWLIENTNKHFVLTGSSARKLKHGGANLLAGRAFVYNLFPFSFVELQAAFDLTAALQWGTLPRVTQHGNEDKNRFLQAYANTYLKEEVWNEHLIRNLDPFRKFLEVAAQCNGKIINYSNIAYDVGVDDKTVKEYLVLLEDTLIGFFLPPFHHSFRKRLSTKPKFYFFDCGVVRALTRTLSIPLVPGNHAYGNAFEHFIILECLKLGSYFKPEYRFSYLRTKDDAEVDLVVERPGLPHLFIEIKSSSNIAEHDLATLKQLAADFKHCEAVCLANVSYAKKYDKITVFPWQDGITQLLLN